jgi:Clp protease
MNRAGGPRGGQNSPWLHEQLCERRIVLVTGRLDDAVAARAAAALISLDAASDAPIELHVNSPDGTLDAAFVLNDVLGIIRAPVRALCRGQVGTPAIGVVAAARQRVAWPHARFRLTQPSVQLSALERPREPPSAHRNGTKRQRLNPYPTWARTRVRGQANQPEGQLARHGRPRRSACTGACEQRPRPSRGHTHSKGA